MKQSREATRWPPRSNIFFSHDVYKCAKSSISICKDKWCHVFFRGEVSKYFCWLTLMHIVEQFFAYIQNSSLIPRIVCPTLSTKWSSSVLHWERLDNCVEMQVISKFYNLCNKRLLIHLFILNTRTLYTQNLFPSHYLKTLRTLWSQLKKLKKIGDISEASVWHGVNLDATSHTSHPPTILPTRDLCWAKSAQAAHDIHLFIPGIINHP